MARPQVYRGSAPEQELEGLLKMVKAPPAEREYRFHPDRRWRFDFCWPEQMVAVEVEGGVWNNGRHTRGSGFVADLSKYNEAALLGYTVLRVTPQMVRNGEVLDLLERALIQVR